MNLVREPDAVNPPVRFDEREVETEHGMRLLRHKRGNPETEYAEAYPTAPPLDSTARSPSPVAVAAAPRMRPTAQTFLFLVRLYGDNYFSRLTTIRIPG
jgi:hypothetical protein